jgi:hypothetical protein
MNMRGRALIITGSILVFLGLFVLSPAAWLLLDQLFQQLFSAPLIGIVIGGGGLIVPMTLTAFGTAGIVGGAWMIANGNRWRRERIERVKRPEPIAKPEAILKPNPMPKPADKPLDQTSIGE